VATTETREVRAEAKWVRCSARKARVVAEHIRGRSVPEARTVLAFTQRAAAREVEKVLRSAVANAEANHQLLGDDLYVVAAYVDEGPTLKRWRARARGRVNRIRKRTCHITLKLAPAENGTGTTAAAVPATKRPRRRSRQEDAAATEAKPGRRRTKKAEGAEPEAPVEPQGEPLEAETIVEAAAEAPAEEQKPKRSRRKRAGAEPQEES
jgi:ribosomal protein L22